MVNKNLKRFITRPLSLVIIAYLSIGLLIGLALLHNQLTSQVNWTCPPGTYGDFVSDTPVSSTNKLADNCERSFTVLEGFTLVGTTIFLWPILAVFSGLKALP